MKNFRLYRNRRINCYVDLKEKIGEYSKLQVEVYYSLGGMNYFSGTQSPRGYKVGFKPCNVSISSSGCESYTFTMMSGNSKIEGGYVNIEYTQKFSKKRLFELAALVDPLVPAIAEAYQADAKNTLIALCRVGKIDTQAAQAPKPIAGPVYQKSAMQILTAENKAALPALYSQDGKDPADVQIVVKFFDPTGSWTWYATEGDKTGEVISEGAFKGEEDYKFFGFVKGFEGELGYFTLGELSTAKGKCTGIQTLPIERDRNFKGTLASVMAKEESNV